MVEPELRIIPFVGGYECHMKSTKCLAQMRWKVHGASLIHFDIVLRYSDPRNFPSQEPSNQPLELDEVGG